MKKISEPIPGLVIAAPTVLGDERGWFMESFSKKFWTQVGVETEFVQDNRSYSRYGTLRGLHFQTGTSAQAKLVTCLRGKVLDVVVDLRKNSPKFKCCHSEILTEENKLQMFVPRGFAHGFIVLSEEAEFFYKCDNFYDAKSERGIIYNDIDLNFNWTIPENQLIISDKDKKLPSMKDILKMDFFI